VIFSKIQIFLKAALLRKVHLKVPTFLRAGRFSQGRKDLAYEKYSTGGKGSIFKERFYSLKAATPKGGGKRGYPPKLGI